METFTNHNGLCVVLERVKDTALIALTYNEITPYVVPMIHKKGESDWCSGKYLHTLDDALKYFNSAVGYS